MRVGPLLFREQRHTRFFILLLLLLLLLLVSFVYLTDTRSGVLRTQKLKSSLLRTQS